MTARIERVLHLDLVPGVRPVLLSEYGIPAEVIPDAAFRRIVAEIADPAPAGAPAAKASALVLGQYLADLGLMTAADECAMYADLVAAAVLRGFSHVVFKPHPSAPARYAEALATRAHEFGAELTIDTRSVPVEVIYETTPPGLVLGCFSTALVTARYWGVPAVSAGTAALLAGLPRFEDSNRIPLVIVAATIPSAVLPSVAPEGAARPLDATEIQEVLAVVSYAMQWRSRFRDRGDVVAALARPGSSWAGAYLPASRRRMLALPGGWPLALSARAFSVVVAGLGDIRVHQRSLQARLSGQRTAALRRDGDL